MLTTGLAPDVIHRRHPSAIAIPTRPRGPVPGVFLAAGLPGRFHAPGAFPIQARFRPKRGGACQARSVAPARPCPLFLHEPVMHPGVIDVGPAIVTTRRRSGHHAEPFPIQSRFKEPVHTHPVLAWVRGNRGQPDSESLNAAPGGHSGQRQPPGRAFHPRRRHPGRRLGRPRGRLQARCLPASHPIKSRAPPNRGHRQPACPVTGHEMSQA